MGGDTDTERELSNKQLEDFLQAFNEPDSPLVIQENELSEEVSVGAGGGVLVEDVQRDIRMRNDCYVLSIPRCY